MKTKNKNLLIPNSEISGYNERDKL